MVPEGLVGSIGGDRCSLNTVGLECGHKYSRPFVHGMTGRKTDTDEVVADRGAVIKSQGIELAADQFAPERFVFLDQ